MRKSTSGKSIWIPMGLRIAFSVVVLVCVVWAGYVIGQTSDQIIKLQVLESEIGRETRFTILAANLEFRWCGSEHLVMNLRGENGGLRLLNIATGQLRRITNDKGDSPVACTPDGRRIFFVDRPARRGHVADVVSGERDAFTSELPFGYRAIEEARSRLSPSGRYWLGVTSNVGKEREIGKSTLLVELPPRTGDVFANGVAWSNDEHAYVLMNHGSGDDNILEINARTMRTRTIKLPRVKNYSFNQLEWDPRRQELYLLGWPDDDESPPKVFRFNPKKKAPPTPIVPIERLFAIQQNGTLLFVRTVGVDFSFFGTASKDRNSAFRELIANSWDGKTRTLMRVPYETSSIANLSVSPDGKRVAVSERKFRDKNAPITIVIFELI